MYKAFKVCVCVCGMCGMSVQFEDVWWGCV